MQHTQEEVKQRVTGIISDCLGASLDEIQGDSLIKDDLGADSLDMIDIGMKLEDAYRISLEEEDYDAVNTVDDLVGLVQKKLGTV